MSSLERVRKEVENIRDEEGNATVEPKIKDLVIGLKMLDIKTIFSCQGHTERDDRYPWVDVVPDDDEKLTRLITWWNRQVDRGETGTRIIWTMKLMPEIEYCLLRLMPKRRDLVLEELQESAIALGQKLQRLERIPTFPEP